jgi:hypothetical protein
MGFDLTGLGSVFDFGAKVIDKIFPDKDAADKAKLEMMKLSQAGEFKEIEQDFELAKKQIEANIAEATKGGLMNQWRPAIGWVCVCAYAFNYLVMPLANWIVLFFNSTAPAIVALDTGELTTLLFGMLGIGGLRTFEKVKGVASK